MDVKAVFWDMDGTLVDSEHLHDAAISHVLVSLKHNPPDNLHEIGLGRSADGVFAVLRERFILPVTYGEWNSLVLDAYLKQVVGLRPRRGAIEVLQELRHRNVPQAVVSNADRAIIDANLSAVNLIYDDLPSISREDVTYGKPDPEPFLLAASRCGVKPQDCIVIEDSIVGATAGLAAGMKTLFWPVAPTKCPEGAIFVSDVRALRDELGLGNVDVRSN